MRPFRPLPFASVRADARRRLRRTSYASLQTVARRFRLRSDARLDFLSCRFAQEALPPIEIGAATPTGPALPSNDDPGTSQGGAGLGGRFTGYNVSGPAVATKDSIPLMQSPINVQIVPREVVDDQQDITVRDAIFGNVSSVQPPARLATAIISMMVSTSGQSHVVEMYSRDVWTIPGRPSNLNLTSKRPIASGPIVGSHFGVRMRFHSMDAPSPSSVSLYLLHSVFDKSAWLKEQDIDEPWAPANQRLQRNPG